MKLFLSLIGAWFLLFTGSVWATPVFEYELYIQAESSLDKGPINIQGKIVNTGMADITQTWSAIWGMPSTIDQTTSSDAIHTIGSLASGETYNFSWLIGTQERDLTSFSGLLLEGVAGFIPLHSDWFWSHVGVISELSASSLWVNGPADSTLPWNMVTINLQTASSYLVTPTPLIAVVSEPASILLFGASLAGLLGIHVKYKRQNHRTRCFI